MEAEESKPEIVNPKRSRIRRRPCDDFDPALSLSTKVRRINGVILAKAKPSYCLKRGIGSLQRDFTSLRSVHRKKLRQLLLLLLRRHNWAESSGVLSLLHRGTSKESAITKTQAKFSATLEILKHLKGDSISSRKIQNIYGMWMSKLGPMKKWPMKNKFAVQLEHTLFCLTSNEMDGAHQASLSLMQERGFEGDPLSNLVVGLTFYELWYSNLPQEMHLGEQKEHECNTQPDKSQVSEVMSIVDSRSQGAYEGQETNSLPKHESNTSIQNGKENIEAGVDQCGKDLMDVETKPQYDAGNQEQVVSLHSDERSEFEKSNNSSPPSLSSFYTHGLSTLLLPIQFPQLDNLEELYDMHRQLRNDQYNSAVKFLSCALSSTPPALEGFHPLIQLLLLGDKVKEALAMVEKISPDASTPLHLRLKAHLLEHFDRNNYAKLATCFEDILQKDPTCDYSLGRLISLYKKGDYSTEKLLEKIASNLDATYAKCNIWREFASLLLKLSQIEGDCVSVCAGAGADAGADAADADAGADADATAAAADADATAAAAAAADDDDDGVKQEPSEFVSSRVPEIFIAPGTGESWRLRCRWWLTHHFSKSILVSDIALGDAELLTYKAASSCHLYGREFGYVVQVSKFLKERNNTDMLLILNRHVHNSAGFYLNLDRKMP